MRTSSLRLAAPGPRLAALCLLLLPAVASAQPADPKPVPPPVTPQPADPVPQPGQPNQPTQGNTGTPGPQEAVPPGEKAPQPPPPGAKPEAAKPTVKPYENIDVVRYSDFMDTRLTWVFGDDDVLKSAGERNPISPSASVGDRRQYRLFFDNLNSRFAGRENLTHLVLYRKMPGFIPNLDTEAALVLRFDMSQLAARSNNVNSAFYDSGSYLRLFYKTSTYELNGEKRNTGFDLIFFPLDTDRFRLGYLYDISWGGTSQSINESIFPRLSGQAPGAKFQYTGQGYYGFLGFKTAQITEPQTKVTGSGDVEFTRIQETNIGVLGGGGADFGQMVRLDVGAGYFQQGRFEQPDVQGKPVYTYGASGRLVFHDKMPVPSSVDFALYRNDPNSPMVIFRPEKYSPGQFSWALSLEGSHLRQNLKEFNVNGATKLQGATAAAVQFTMKSGFFRLQSTGIFRDLAFVLRNQPSFIPFETMPKEAKTQPEILAALAGDYFFEDLHLTPGIGVGVQMPATFGSSATDIFGSEISSTSIIRRQGDQTPLPQNKKRVPIVNARASLRWDLNQMMAINVWAQFVRDNNATRIEQAEDGTTYQRTFVAPDFLGFGTAVQARF
jgi:hypothetical protein